MKLIHRLGYYLSGFAIGLIFLAFFLKGKDVGCDYSPDARVKKNIRIKTPSLSADAREQLTLHRLDSTVVSYLLQEGSVDFSKSDTKADSCKTYVINGKQDDRKLSLTVKNCPETAQVLEIWGE